MKFNYDSRLPACCLWGFFGSIVPFIGLIVCLTILDERSGQEFEIAGSWIERTALVLVSIQVCSIVMLFSLLVVEIARGWRNRSPSRNGVLVAAAILGNGWTSVLACNGHFRKWLFGLR